MFDSIYSLITSLTLNFQHSFLPSETIVYSFFKMLPRMVFKWHSLTRGVAPSSLYPGLLTFNHSVVRPPNWCNSMCSVRPFSHSFFSVSPFLSPRPFVLVVLVIPVVLVPPSFPSLCHSLARESYFFATSGSLSR